MPKIAKELSNLAVSKIKTKGRHAVGGVPGLHLLVSETQARSWILRIKIDSKRRDIGLGSYSELSLSDARDLAREYRKNVIAGIDPLSKRRAIKSQLQAQHAGEKSFKECAEAYIQAKSSEWKNPKHHQQWKNTLATYAFPHIGHLQVSDIQVQHVLACLDPIWKSKNETANRLRGRIESVLAYATARKYRTGDNPAQWKNHLDAILPAPSKIQNVQHHKSMPFKDVGAFLVNLQKKRGITPQALQFLILTAARSGEIRGATWDEIDFDARVWTIPANRMKAGKEHRVPLSKQAIMILKALPKIEASPYIFPAPRGGQLTDMALTEIMRGMGWEYVPHGFRSSFRDWVGETTEYSRELAEQALAHTLKSKVEAAYRRGDALTKRDAMMQAWADYLYG